MRMIELAQIPSKEVMTGYHARFVHSENMTLVYWDIEAGGELPEHSHRHEQVVNVLEGRFKLKVDGEISTLEPGTVIVIPPNARHSGVAVTDCRILDVFYPIREDYR